MTDWGKFQARLRSETLTEAELRDLIQEIELTEEGPEQMSLIETAERRLLDLQLSLDL